MSTIDYNAPYQHTGCGIISVLGLLVCLAYTIPSLLTEYRAGKVVTDYVAVPAEIYNFHPTEANYFPGLRYTFAGEQFVTETFFSETEWPLGLESWHRVKNTITAAGQRGEQVVIYVDRTDPSRFSLVDAPGRDTFLYTAILLAGILVFGGLLWAVKAEVQRKRWTRIEAWTRD